ncbi:MAG: SDR family oxidoreductase [Magnetococcales bacterium]|nr:SDR family oxidoreductase [Magnetococcales bacterium]
MTTPPRTALITGGARRIGATLVRALAQRGYTVVIHHHRSQTEAQHLADDIRTQGGHAHAIQADLSNHDATMSLIAHTEQLLAPHPLTLLVNNAAIFEAGALRHTSYDAWQNHLAINLTAPFLLTRDFARRLPPGVTGQVIQIIDRYGHHPRSGYAAYSAAKSALWTLTRLAALELAPTIRINAIGPGPILPAAGDTPEQFARIAAATPMQRPGQPHDIVAALFFLLEHDFITGEMIRVDGGEHLR